MKRLFTILISLVCVLACRAEITSISEALASHRAWMATNTPRPETLSDEELMLHTLDIINLRLKETEAFRIIATAAQKVPEVESYLNWEATMQCDPRLQHTRDALRGMRDYLEKNHPGCYASRRLQLEWLKHEGVFRNVMPDFDSLIASQQKACHAAADMDKKHEESLLVLIKLARFDHRSTLEVTDNPAHYPELWQLEEEVLRLYPIACTDTVADRMDLYCELAPLKALPREYDKVLMMFPDGYEPFLTDQDMKYTYSGNFGDYLCNTMFLNDIAGEISAKLYGEFHPNTAGINFHNAQYELYNQTFTLDLQEQIRNINDYISFYYPKNSVEAAYSKLAQLTSEYFSTGTVSDPSALDEIEDVIKGYYGDDTQFYLNALASLTSLRLHSGRDISRVLENYESACSRICSNPLQQAMWKLFPYSELLFIDVNSVSEKMLSLKDVYLKEHDGSPISLHLGEQLLNYFRSNAFDFDSAREISKAVEDDNKTLFGAVSAPYLLAVKNTVYDMSRVYNPEEADLLDGLVNLASVRDFTACKYTRKKLLEAKANYQWHYGQYEESHKAYEKLHGNNLNESNLYPLIRDALSIAYIKGVNEKTEKYIKFCREYLDASEIINLAPNMLIEMAEYYCVANSLQDAVAMLEKGMEAHNLQTNGALDDEYFDIASRLSNLYSDTNNITAASRLVISDRETLINMTRLQPSPLMINYFLNQYYWYAGRNDMNSAIFYLQMTFQMLNNIATTSQKDNTLKYTLMPRFLQAFMNFVNTMYTQIDGLAEYFESEEYKSNFQYIHEILAQYESFMPGIKELMIEIKDSFPEYDTDYKTNLNYISVLSSLAIYYDIFEKDYLTAESYLCQVAGLYENPADKKSMYFRLASLMKKAGDEKKRDAYERLAYTTIEQNPEKMTESNLLSAISYRFVKDMEKGDMDSAIEKARKLYTGVRGILDKSFQLMTSYDQNAVFSQYGDPAWALTTVLEKRPEEMAAETYDAIVYRTGMQLRSQQELKRLILASDNPEIKVVADSISRMRAQQKAIPTNPDLWNTEQGNANFQRTTDLNFRIELLEQRLLDLTADMRNAVNPDIPWQKIRDSLSEGEAAVEFLFSHTSIMALMLTRGCTAPRAVELCKWKEFSDKLNALHSKNSAALARKLYGGDSARELYAMLWQPLEPHLQGVSTIYFNAPGILHSIAFNALRSPEGDYLIDRYDLRQLTTTAQLTFDSEVRAPRSAALVGDVLFDPAQESQAGKLPEESGERNIDEDYSLTAAYSEADSRGIVRHNFRYLPFTATEIQGIRSSLGDTPVSTATRFEATEEGFRRLCDSHPEALHIATHGFFLSSEQEAMRVPFMRRYSAAVGSPMQRSGIALAGAEATWTGRADLPEDADGILTANEVAQLNLKDTRLVALSACETALGGYNFDGIHGLTRGFKQAGAKSLLVSLWSVNDRSTSIFMNAFYSHWHQNGDRHAAYRHAIAEVRAAYPSPFYWAPFILLD